jgi:hypothetical protein
MGLDFTPFRLTPAEREELFAAQDELTVSWTNDAGWPVAVVQTFVWHDGAFWITAFRDKPRVGRLEVDDRAAVAVSSKGTDVGIERMVGVRVRAAVHDDGATAAWFYRAFAARHVGSDEAAIAKFAARLAKQDRVVIELRPEPRSWTSFDGMLLRRGGRR